MDCIRSTFERLTATRRQRKCAGKRPYLESNLMNSRFNWRGVVSMTTCVDFCPRSFRNKLFSAVELAVAGSILPFAGMQVSYFMPWARCNVGVGREVPTRTIEESNSKNRGSHRVAPPFSWNGSKSQRKVKIDTHKWHSSWRSWSIHWMFCLHALWSFLAEAVVSLAKCH